MEPFQTASDVWQFLHARGLAVTHIGATGREDLDSTHLLFRLGGQRYAIPSARVTTVQRFGCYKPLPLAQPYLVGMAFVQGRELTILDVGPLLKQRRTPPHPTAILIITELAGVEVALLADSMEAATR